MRWKVLIKLRYLEHTLELQNNCEKIINLFQYSNSQLFKFFYGRHIGFLLNQVQQKIEYSVMYHKWYSFSEYRMQNVFHTVVCGILTYYNQNN